MANKKIFGGKTSTPKVRPTDTVNEAGGTAYALSAESALAQLVCTGTINDTFYSTAEQQVEKLLECAAGCDSVFLAKAAKYGRRSGYMKDLPAAICAILAARKEDGISQLRSVFPQVIDSGKMLRNFVQITRSGVTGRKSFGSAVKRMIQEWIQSRSAEQLLRDNVGNDPKLSDIFRMVHPRPKEEWQVPAFAYIMGKKIEGAIPTAIESWEQFKQTIKDGAWVDPPKQVPFQLITGLELNDAQWCRLADTMSWNELRMNLQSLARHGAFKDPARARTIANRLMNEEDIAKSRLLPYQAYMTYVAVNDNPEIPSLVSSAMGHVLNTVAKAPGTMPDNTYVFVDVSGSMSWSSITGGRKGATSKMKCSDVAVTYGALLLNGARNGHLWTFDTMVQSKFRQADIGADVAAFAKRVHVNGGGTNIGAPLSRLADSGAQVDFVVILSDDMSWFTHEYGGTYGTPAAEAWAKIRKRNPNARLVCLNLQPYGSTPVADDKSVMNLGGFSAQTLNTISDFANGKADTTAEHWVNLIKQVEL